MADQYPVHAMWPPLRLRATATLIKRRGHQEPQQ